MITLAQACAAAAVAEWLSVVNDLTFKATEEECRAANRACESRLIALLKHTGDLPHWIGDEVHLEFQSCEHECADFFHAAGITRVNLDGTIDQFPN